VSFDVADISFNRVEDDAVEDLEVQYDDVVENSLPFDDDNDSDTETTYTLVNGGSSRGRDKLVDNHGYSYTIKKRYVNAISFVFCQIFFQICTVNATISELEEKVQKQ